METSKGMKTVIEAFKEKMTDKIENERDEKRKEILIKALQRGTELLEGKS
ncbi:MAG: hypothetical protein HXS44_12870 [Theionarchaea archaeon]|nr:hypothetical protein [Theionarchaea archaeon]